MDKQTMALMIPVLALSIPVVAIIFGSLVKMAKFKAEASHGALANPEMDHRLAALEDEVVTLREDLSETQERLDFTERMLAQKSSAKD